MKKALETINRLERQLTSIILMVGVCFVLIFAIIGYSYLRGELVLVDGKVTMDLTSLVIGMDGMIAYVWIGLLSVWVILKAIQWAIKGRNWWVHSEQHKIEIKRRAVPLWNTLRGINNG